MGWETIENLKPSKPSVPDRGVVVATRRAMRDSRFITIKIGAGLAKAVSITHDEQIVRLMMGGGSDAGKIGISVDLGGGFTAKRQKSGSYTLTINRAAAEGLFSLEFPAFTVDRIEAVRPVNGQPPMFAFKASPEMLAVGDD